MTQNLSFSRLKDCTDVRLFKSQMRIVLSSPTDKIRSWCGWNKQAEVF